MKARNSTSLGNYNASVNNNFDGSYGDQRNEDDGAIKLMKEAAKKLLEKKQQVLRTQQVTNFIDQLQTQGSQAVSSFIREFNKEQMMNNGKSQVYGFNKRGNSTIGFPVGLGALSVASVNQSRQKKVGRESELYNYQDFQNDYRSGQNQRSRLGTSITPYREGSNMDSRWRENKIKTAGRDRLNQTQTSFFNSRTQKRLQTAASTNEYNFQSKFNRTQKSQGRSNRHDEKTIKTAQSIDKLNKEKSPDFINSSFQNTERQNNGSNFYSSIDQQNKKIAQYDDKNSESDVSFIQQGINPKNYSQLYYYKYIHEENRKMLMSQKAKRNTFILEKDAEQSTYQQRYQGYLDKINQEEGSDFKSELEIRKQSLMDDLAKTDFKLKLAKDNMLVENLDRIDELIKLDQSNYLSLPLNSRENQSARKKTNKFESQNNRKRGGMSVLHRQASKSSMKDGSFSQSKYGTPRSINVKQNLLRTQGQELNNAQNNKEIQASDQILLNPQGKNQSQDPALIEVPYMTKDHSMRVDNPKTLDASYHLKAAKTSLYKNRNQDQIQILSKDKKSTHLQVNRRRDFNQTLLNIQESSSETLNTISHQQGFSSKNRNSQQNAEDNSSTNKPISRQVKSRKKRVSQAVYLDNIKRLKDFVKGEHFKVICQLDAQQQQTVQFRNCRLTKNKFKQYLMQKYNNHIIADKLVMIFDFTNPIDFPNFVQQCENFLKNKDVLKLIAFDIYDFNNDGKISDLDLFKLFQFFSKGHQQTLFEKIFQVDLLQICKRLALKRFPSNPAEVHKVTNIETKEYLTQTQTHNNHSQDQVPSQIKVENLSNNDKLQEKQDEDNKNNKDKVVLAHILHPPKLKLESFSNYHRGLLSESNRKEYFRNANNLSEPLYESKRKRVFQAMYKLQSIMESGANWGPQLYKIQRDLDKGDNSSDNEDANNEENDVFGSSNHYLKLLKNLKAGKLKSNQAHTQAQIDEYKKQMTMNGQGGNSEQLKNLSKISRSSSLAKNTLSVYQQQKILKQMNQQHQHHSSSSQNNQAQNFENVYSQDVKLNTLSPDLPYSKKQIQQEKSNPNLLSIPHWDEFFNAYMERAQSKINISIKLEDFSRIKFSEDLELPNFIIDFIDYLLGVNNLYKKILTQNLQKDSASTNIHGQVIFENEQFKRTEGDMKIEDNQFFDDTREESRNTSQVIAFSNTYDVTTIKSQNILAQLGNSSAERQQPQSALSMQSQEQNSEAQKKFQAQLLNLRHELTLNQYNCLLNAFIILSGNATPELIQSQTHLNHSQAQKKNTFLKISNSLAKSTTTVNTKNKLGGFNPLSKINAKIKEAFAEKLQLMDLYLTEKSIVENFNTLFGGYQNENKERRNQFVFRLLDVGNEKKLNVLHLIQYFKNIKTNTAFGQEILSLFMEYKDKNILMRAGYRQQIQLNFITYSKIVKYSCLVDELQLRIFGGVFPSKEDSDESSIETYMETYRSPFKEISERNFTETLVIPKTRDQGYNSLNQTLNASSGLNSAMKRHKKDLSTEENKGLRTNSIMNKYPTMYISQGMSQSHSKNHSMLASHTSLADNLLQVPNQASIVHKNKNKSMAQGANPLLLPPQISSNENNQRQNTQYWDIDEKNKKNSLQPENKNHSKSSSQGGINSLAKLSASNYWYDGTIAQYIITDTQYEKLFSNEELMDAPRILQKLK